MKQETGVRRQIKGLADMRHEELKALWKTLYGNEPPTYHREYIINRLAYRIQELTYGGLSETTLDRMRQILVEYGYDQNGMKIQIPGKRKNRRATDDMPILGTKLVREWKGTMHEVMIVPHGVEYKGKRYKSLSAIACVITGCHWNGRLFFGLESRGASK